MSVVVVVEVVVDTVDDMVEVVVVDVGDRTVKVGTDTCCTTTL